MAADRAVADRDEKSLVGHRRQTQHAVSGFLRIDSRRIERYADSRQPHGLALHARRFAEQRRHIHIDRRIAKMPVGNDQTAVGARRTDDGKRAALARADGAKFGQPRGRNGQHVALLRFVAPDFRRRHASFLDRHLAQFEARTDAAAVRQFRKSVGQPARAHVVNRQDRVAVARLRRILARSAQAPAGVDDFLRTPLHFRIAALYRGKIESFGIRAGAHRTGRTAAQADQHSGAAQLNQQGAGGEFGCLVRLAGGDVAHSARHHDRLVIAADNGVFPFADALLIGTEIAGQIRPAEFVVESRRANRPVEHNRQRRGNARRPPVSRHCGFPRLRRSRQIEVGDGEAAEAGF